MNRGTVALLCLIPAVAVGLYLGFTWAPAPESDVQLSQTALSELNVQDAPTPDPEPPPPLVASSAQSGAVGGIAPARPTGPGRASQGSVMLGSERERELAFIRAHDGVLRRYQTRLDAIGMRYRRSNAVVREVDLAFGKLPRYLALRDQYAKDRDAFKWARDTVALPEVRRLVFKYAGRADVWKAGIGMMVEALKEPPPAPIYKEMKNFLTNDRRMIGFLEEFAQQVGKKLPTVLPQLTGLEPEMKRLQKLAEDLAPASAKEALRAQTDPKKRR